REAGEGPGVARIDGDGLLEMKAGLVERLPAELSQELAAPGVGLPRAGAGWGSGGDLPDLERGGQRIRQAILQLEDSGESAVGLFHPERRAGGDFKQAAGDAQRLAGAPAAPSDGPPA